MSNDATRHVQAIVDEVRRRWRRLERRRWIARGALALALVWAAALVAWLVAARESAAAQVMLAGVAALASIVCLVLVWRQRAPMPTARQLARLIEDRVPGLDDRLATAVDVLSSPDGHGAISEMLVADTARRIDPADVDMVIAPAALRRAALQAGGAAALLLAVGIVAWKPAATSGRAALLWLSPERLVLDIEPGDARVKPGEPLTIRAMTSAASRGIVPELVVRIQDASRTERLSEVGPDQYAIGFKSVPRSFTYQVRVAGRTSREYNVTLLAPPRIARIDLGYTYPAFTGMAPRTETDNGDIYAPDGTKVAVTVTPKTTTAPVESAAIVMRDGREVALHRSGDAFTGEIVVAGDSSYRVRLRDADGLENVDDPEYFVRRVDDRPPTVRILAPAGDRQVTPLEEVAIEARADDDHGVAQLELRYSVRGEKWRSVPLPATGGLTATGRHTVFLEDLGVEPGDFVSYYARARDVGRGKRPSEARSDIFFLEVTPYIDEFALAQSQAMAGAGGQGMDDLVRLQKDIIAGTWKLQRRAAGAAAGPSVADFKTLGRAQGTLRDRVERAGRQEQMFEGRRRRRSFSLPEPRESEPALLDAARAMARAAQALNAVKPDTALPAEMEALNHLLRAEAEIRRKEITRQRANGGGGGSNRAQQDLSALFDRELQRQQETNYETPATAEERNDQAEGQDDLLERVRALAQRQEALQRQQEELARDRKQLEEQELRRRLERLTRDQNELRRQAENLARQMQQQARQQATQSQQGQRQQGQSQSGEPSQSSSGQQAGSAQSAQQGAQALRDASEEMRAAAGELRRESPESARQRSANALGRLQELERGMRATAPDEQRRAAGDAQLEARQLADRQRQLAEQTARAGVSANEDARRRLAGEQQRLAERADALGERVKRLAEAATDGADRQRLAEAARTAESGRLGQQMREVAERVRKGGPEAGREAERQREIARALERLGDRVAGSPGGGDREDQQAADDLSKARDLRERLADLQKQIEAVSRAEAQARDGQPQGRDGRQAGSRAEGQASGQSARAGDTPEGRQRKLNELRREYLEELRNAGSLRDRLEQASPGTGRAMSTPVDQQMVTSAPGTEAFKQDFSEWESLHKEVTLGLEKFEAALSQRAVEREARERLRAGDATRVPERYRGSVDRYYRALAQEPR